VYHKAVQHPHWGHCPAYWRSFRGIKYLREKEKRKDFPRILQFSSEDRMTKYEICQKLAQVLGVAIPGMIANKQGNDPNAGIKSYSCTGIQEHPMKRTYHHAMKSTVFTSIPSSVRRELGAYRK
jgi:hypothetical protein